MRCYTVECMSAEQLCLLADGTVWEPSCVCTSNDTLCSDIFVLTH